MDERPVPRLTWRSLVMGAFVSIGGIIFGYDTGQISGFLEMKNYLRRYGEADGKGGYEFSNVRSGLIVGLVSHALHGRKYLCGSIHKVYYVEAIFAYTLCFL